MLLCQRFADLVAQDLRRQAVGLEHGVGRAAAAEGVVHAMANERRGAVLAQELGNGAAEAMRLAMEEAGISPEEVDYINAHGTSTHHNDLFETRAIKRAFGEQAAKAAAINSTKSMVGHMLGAAGAVELITCVKAIEEGYVHQTMGTCHVDEECDLNYTVGKPIEKNIRYAMSNSFGFGGHNAVLVVKKI